MLMLNRTMIQQSKNLLLFIKKNFFINIFTIGFYLLNIVSLCFSNDAQRICNDRFVRFTRLHTACVSPNTKCRILSRGLEENSLQHILDIHNQYRAFIAAGNESRIGFPGASNMLKLEWDAELAYVAQAHADQCKFEHDCYDCRRTGKYKVVGQNLYVYQTSRTGPTVKQDWKSIIKEWYDEIKIAPPSVARSFALHELNIGHFTQVAWASTNRIGCGTVTYNISGEPAEGGYGISPFKTATLYTCNYAPGGNFLGEKMYRNGPAASQCPKLHKPSSTWPELCELTSTIKTTSIITSSRVNVSTAQVTSSHFSANNENINNQVTSIVRKKITNTQKKTKKIIKKINNANTNNFITTTIITTNTNSNSNASRPKILVNLLTPRPSILNWNISPPVNIVQPPIIIPTSKPLSVSDTSKNDQHSPKNKEKHFRNISYESIQNHETILTTTPNNVPSIITSTPSFPTITSSSSNSSGVTTTTTTSTTTTLEPKIEEMLITELIPTTNSKPIYSTTRTPVTMRPLNSGGTQLVVAVAPWWRKWIVNTSTTRRPTRSRLLVTSSINRTPFQNTINKWPGSVSNRKPIYSSLTHKPNNWGNLLTTSSSNQIPRFTNAHWSSQNRYFLTHNLTNSSSPKPLSFSSFNNFNSLNIDENNQYSRFTFG